MITKNTENKLDYMKSFLIYLSILFCVVTQAQEKNKILVLGTFHFHLTATQLGVNFNIENRKNQEELQILSKQIAQYKPTKIFVEWNYTKQEELDELFQLYLKDTSFDFIKKKYGENETKYFDSEVQQLGFRIAKQQKLSQLYAFDYFIEEPNDTIMKSLQKNNQHLLMAEMQKDFENYGQKIITKFKTTDSLKDILLFLNTKEIENQINNGYITFFNRIGSIHDFSGAYFVSERNKRNLYMYSLIQKQVLPHDERVLVIVGAQHSATFKELIKNDFKFELIDIKHFLN